jgi:YVTN family beta-propeller protein
MSLRVSTSLVLAFATLGGCTGDDGGGAILARPSKSGTIDITADDGFVAMVNPEDDSVSVFRVADDVRVARITTGDEPSAVVFHPDGKTFFVANRAAANVVRVSNFDAAAPQLTPVDVGSEPVGLALSPTGAKLFVAEFAEGRISVIDTKTMQVVGTIESPERPRALAVTNNLDANDADELLIVPEFYGEPVAGKEAKDDGRTGRIRIYEVGSLQPRTPILLSPLDSGFAPDGSPEGTPTVKTSPNALYSVAIRAGRVYVTSVSASPERPIKFNTNVQPVVYVGNLADSTENLTNVGTTNLARLVKARIPSGPRFFLADLVDLVFFGSSDGNVAYAVSRGGDVIQRVVYDDAAGVQIGSPQNVQIDLLPSGCKNPTGAVAGHKIARLYVNCWVTRNLAIINLGDQVVASVVESTPAAVNEDAEINEGRRFYFTGRGRWSNEAWNSCASCHPDGLSDNITWIFGTGPRQTTSMDGSFSHGLGQQKRRVFNWTAVNDEMDDFERNTRDTAGGLGAITAAKAGGTCGVLADEVRDPELLPATTQLADPVRELQDRNINCTKDWEKIDKWVATIRPPRGLKTLDAAAVQRGAQLFSADPLAANAGGCVKCHGGPGWTASRRFYEPQGGDTGRNKRLTAAAFVAPDLWPDDWNKHTLQIAAQPPGVDPGFAGAIPVAQVACVLRNVGTFGIFQDAAGTDALEQRAAPFGVAPDTSFRAQGAGGYNVPSLYGLS